MHYLVLTEDGHVQEMRFEQITLGHQDCCSKLKYHHAELKLIVFKAIFDLSNKSPS